MKIKVRQLDRKEQEGFEYYNFWVNDILNRGFQLNKKLNGTEEDLQLLQLILDNGPYSDNAEDELVIIGYVFGNVISKKLEMTWVVYQDKDGIDFALKYKNKCIFSFPQYMLLKRAEKGELGNLINLYNETINTLKKEISKPNIEVCDS